MDQQHDLVGRVVEVADDLLDQDMDEALLGARVGRRRVPGRRQIVGELASSAARSILGERRRSPAVPRSDARSRPPSQGAVPARLQFARDEALGGVDQFVSARREARFIARRFEVALRRGDDVVCRAFDLIRSEDGGFDGAIGDCLEDLQGDGAIDPNAADADAQAGADMTSSPRH